MVIQGSQMIRMSVHKTIVREGSSSWKKGNYPKNKLGCYSTAWTILWTVPLFFLSPQTQKNLLLHHTPNTKHKIFFFFLRNTWGKDKHKIIWHEVPPNPSAHFQWLILIQPQKIVEVRTQQHSFIQNFVSKKIWMSQRFNSVLP